MFRTFAQALALSTALATAALVGTAPMAGTAHAASVAETKAQVRKAKRVVASRLRAVAKAKRRVAALERRMKGDARRLARQKSAKARSKLKARIRKAKAGLRKARKAWRVEVRAHNRAMRVVKRGDRLTERARATARRERKRGASRARTGRGILPRLSLSGTVSRAKSGWIGRQIFGSSSGPRAGAYGARVDNGFALPGIPVKALPKRLLRQQVRYRTAEKPGTIIVDTKDRYLYLVQPGGSAMRYGIGVGRSGFGWSGTAHVGWKQVWPKWTPPAEMIARQPKYAKYSARNGGMPGGLRNPLGARALYLVQGGKDTLYRLHGTPNWRSIGTNSSSGCIRLMNQDVIDLYARTKMGAKVIVR